MKNPRLILVSLLPAMWLAACAPESKTVYARRDVPDVRVDVDQPAIPKDERVVKRDPPPPPAKPGLTWITQDGGQRQFDFKPQTDILFVIDNSDSMKEEQENLSRNINLFARDLRKNRMIDYHIGVVSVWDNSDRAARKATHANGELRRVKNTAGREGKARFVTRRKSDDALLAPTLKIGVMPYSQGGPEVEEVFSPLANALKKTGRGDVNEGFFREDAQLVIVVVTDADDSTANISPEQMAEEILRFKGGNKDLVTAYGVLTRKGDPDSVKDWGLRIHPNYHPECFEKVQVTVSPKKKTAKPTVRTQMKNNGTCKGFGPERLEQFLELVNAGRYRADEVQSKLILSLNQADYGKDLSKIGADIAIRALEKKIVLEHVPRRDDATGKLLLRVRYGLPKDLARGGGQVIPAGAKGWLYNSGTNTIQLAGDVVYSYVENARFAVDLVPVTYENIAPTAEPSTAAEPSPAATPAP